MRVTAQVPANILTTSVNPGNADRHVRLNVFVPKALGVRSQAWINWRNAGLDWIRYAMLRNLELAGVEIGGGADNLFGTHSFRRFAISRVSSGPRQPGITIDPSSISGLLENLRAAGSARDLARHFDEFVIGAAQARQKDATEIRRRLAGTKLYDALSIMPDDLAADSSEMGFLYLDRTRVRPIGFELGEHVETIGLAAGEETVFEVRTFLRESQSLEDTLEREYERNLESSTQDTQTDTQSQNVSDNQGTSLSRTNQASLDASAPPDTVPVEAQVGTSSNDSLQASTALATQISTTRSITASEKVSARLRVSHKVTTKETVESGIETLTRKVIRNPNAASPIALHYFKIMQRLEMQQERTGVRLCWAPFVMDPGAQVRRRMIVAAKQVYDAAVRALDLPPAPTPPQHKMAPLWKEGIMETVEPGPGGQFHEIVHLKVTLDDIQKETYTGQVRVRKEGSGAARVSVNIFDFDPAPTSDGVVKIVANVEDGANYLGMFDEVRLTPLVEIMRELPGYAAANARYQQLLIDHNAEVTRLTRVARDEARPEADAARLRVLASTDIRSELMGSVVNQFLRSSPDGSAYEIEFWNRVFEFEDASYKIYPGWWSDGRIHVPEMEADHFVNASVARVFLPIRPGYEGVFVERMLVPSLAGPSNAAALAKIKKELVDDLAEAHASFIDNGRPKAVALGRSWTDYTPTNGLYVETEICASTAADPLTERQVTAAVGQLEVSVQAEAARNALRSNPPTGATVKIKS